MGFLNQDDSKPKLRSQYLVAPQEKSEPKESGTQIVGTLTPLTSRINPLPLWTCNEYFTQIKHFKKMKSYSGYIASWQRILKEKVNPKFKACYSLN